MQTEGSVAPPQLSPDGQWWWDGGAWVPAPAAGPAPRAHVAVPTPAPEPGATASVNHVPDPSLPSDSLTSLAASPVPRPSSPFAEFTAAPAVPELPTVTAPYRAPAYQAAVYQPVPVPSVESPGRTLGLVSLICSIVGLALPAVVIGHVSRRKDRAAGMPPNGLALAGLIIGYVWMVLVVLSLVAAVLVPTFLAQRVKAENAGLVRELTGVAGAQQTHRINTGRYSASLPALVDVGYSPDPTVRIDVLSAGATSFCVRALEPAGSGQAMYVDATGAVTAAPCA